ncbi:MAG: DUF2889 domain-containing protein [Novosphingobium sp.]|nr:DUF2889 domain-containing protein [Novosphingobium sp.]
MQPLPKDASRYGAGVKGMGKPATSERLTSYPPNPAYGTGVCRRRICFTADRLRMTVSLFDDFHDMVVEIEHDGHSVTAISGEMRRFPKTTCPGAVALLQQFVGCLIAEGRAAIAGRFSRGAHCTHLIDMATLGVSAIHRDVKDECVELSISDKDEEERQTLIAHAQGSDPMVVELRNDVIVSPAEFSGQSLFGGFGRWADKRFTGFARDIWQMAQMIAFISHGRQYIVDGVHPIAARNEPQREGACYSYSKPAFDIAVDTVGYVRDHTAGLPPREQGRA